MRIKTCPTIWNTTISKFLNGISVGKLSFPDGHKGQYFLNGREVLFFRPTFFRPILKSGISTDYYCFNHKFKYKSKGIEVNGVSIHLI